MNRTFQKLAEFDPARIEIKLFDSATFSVLNGVGGAVSCDPKQAILSVPNQPLNIGTTLDVTASPQTFNVRGVSPGIGLISFQRLFAPVLGIPLPIALIVRDPNPKPREFVKSIKRIEHNHQPCGKWSEISRSPNNLLGGTNDSGIVDSLALTAICRGCNSPKCVVDKVLSIGFGNLPVARDHIMWYLGVGGGRDFDESGNITSWLKGDSGIRRSIRDELNKISDKTGKKPSDFEFLQESFKENDFRNAFGSIDRVDCEFDFDQDECTVWFQDRYEWHPVYPGLYELKDGDDARATNCAHAAFVEMKLAGAKDFWMKGQATVPMSVILKP